ncbi:GGDEF domain-containing protein [Acinetobacter amyesii]|uniref:GGDEF domain-containing protein n=1 Tax=Acinetobacter amyesii TaxID=2942470 RepID=UPI003EFBF4BA
MLKKDLIKSDLPTEQLAVLEALPMPAALFSATAELICANQIFKHRFQSDLQEIVLNHVSVMQQKTKATSSEFDLRCLENDSIEPFMYSENERHYWFTLKPKFQQSGDLEHVLLCCADITNLKQFELSLLKHNQQLEQQVYFDYLTGIKNRRGFDLDLSQWQKSFAVEQANEICLIMLDLDNFKQINDIYGHAFGDEILRKSAQLLRMQISQHADAQIYRMGGEEFAMILPRTAISTACSIAQQCCEQIYASSMNYADKALQLSISCGVALWDGTESFFETLARADQALYQAKKGSKNCTCFNDGQNVALFEETTFKKPSDCGKNT